MAAAVAVAVVASGCAATPLMSVDPFDISTSTDWDPSTLAPLAFADTGKGALPPSYPSSVVTEQQGLAVSLQPTLQVTAIPPGQASEFSLSTIGARQPQLIWQQAAPTNQVRVPAGVLKQGGVYQWQARSVAKNQISGPYIMNVDAVRASAQPNQPVGPVNVALASGEASVGISPREVSSVSGSLGVALTFSAGQEADPGLPAGWQMHVQDRGWEHIQSYPNGTIDLVTGTGRAAAYTVNSDGISYTPVLPAGLLAATGSSPTVAKNPDGTWTVTASSGKVWTFATPDSDGKAYLTESFNGVAPGPIYQVSNGRIDSVKDSVSNSLEVDLAYQGGPGDCPSVPDGFVEPATGLLCGISYPDGTSMGFYYVVDTAGDQYLARTVDYVGAQDGKAKVTDFGYDQAGRIASVRDPLAANVQASGVRSDTSALLTTIAYDSSGRVQSVTKPAAQANLLQPAISFVYEPNLGVTEVHSNGPATSAGYDSRVTYDLTRLNPLNTVDGFGGKATDTYLANTDLQLTSTNEWGYTTAKSYDDQQRIQSTTGPYQGKSPGNGTMKTTYQHDQQFLGNEASDLHGFNVTYWANGDLTGSPASRTFGPRFEGNVPLEVNWNWPTSPVDSGQPWSARLTGTVTTTGTGTGAKTPVYGFSVGPAAAKLWVDNVACPAPSCSLPLIAGEHQIRIDLSGSQSDSNSVTGLVVKWQPPGASALTPVPITAIRPGYEMNSVITNTGEALSADQAYQPSSFVEYAEPATGNQTAAWVQQASEAKGTSAFEPYAPDQGQFGRSLSNTAPAGNSTNYTYYGTDESVSVPCSGMGSITQYGRPKETIRSVAPGGTDTAGQPTQTYTAYYGTMGELVAARTNDGDPDCYYYDDDGALKEKTTPARGNSPETSLQYMQNVDGNPLKGSTVVSSGDQKYVTTVEVDLYGNPITSTEKFYQDAGNPTATNSWGSTTSSTYDPFTNAPLTSQVTLSSGRTSTTAYTYYPQGQIEEIQVDGVTLVTAGLLTGSGTKFTYGNGVDHAATVDVAGNSSSETWASKDGKNFSHSADTSPTTRILKESYQFGSAASSAAMNYTYDKRGRLAGADLTTSLAVAHKSWQFGFDTATLGSSPNAGLNSNRTQQIVDGVTTNYGYNATDQLTQTSDPVIGNTVNYSGWGEITNLGPLTIDYDANSAVSRIVDTAANETVTYNRMAGTVHEKTVQSSSGTTVNRYTAGGFILDSNNNARWQGIELPGNTVLLRDLSGTDNERWQYQTPRGQLMWVADQNGHDTGERHLYSPFGEELIAAGTTSPAPSPSKDSTPPVSGTESAKPEVGSRAATPAPAGSAATSSPSPSATSPSSSPSGSPSPSPSGSPSSSPEVQDPDLGWMAGHGQETQRIGSVTVVDMGSRLYVPALGRFTSPDPVDGGSVNAYDYVNQDPVNQQDASGSLPSWFESLMLTVAVAAIVTVVTWGAGLAVASAGLTADWATSAGTGGRLLYYAVNVGITAVTSLGSTALENKIEYGEVSPGGWSNKPVLWEETAVTVISVYASIYCAGGALGAAALKRSLSKQSTRILTYVSQKAADTWAAVKASGAPIAEKAGAAYVAAKSTATGVVESAASAGPCGKLGRAVGSLAGYSATAAYTGSSVAGAAGGAAGYAVGGAVGDAADRAVGWVGSWLSKIPWTSLRPM